MRTKRIRLTALIIIIALVAAGCWDSRDVEDKDIAISIAVDKNEQGNLVFYVKIASISAGQQGGQQSGQEQSSSRLLMAEGKTFIEARENIDRLTDSPIFLGAVQTVILTDRLARSGIEDYMLRLRQTPEYRKTLDVVITTTEPKELMEFQPENSQSVGFAIESTIKSLVDTGQTFHFTLGELLGAMASHNKCYLLHTVALKEDIAVIGYSVFDNSRCVGFIPIEQGKGILFLKADQAKPNYIVQFSNGDAAIKVRSASKDIKSFLQNGNVSFNVSLNVDAQVLSLSKNMKISEGTRKEITASLEKKILDDVSSAIMTSQGFGCDYLNFYTPFRIAYPEEVKRMDWKQQYARARFNVSVNVKLDIVSTVNYAE